MTREEKLKYLAAQRDPSTAILSHIQTLKGEKGDVGPMGPEGKNGFDGKTIVGPSGRNPLTVSATAPKNPQIGDLWYQN